MASTFLMSIELKRRRGALLKFRGSWTLKRLIGQLPINVNMELNMKVIQSRNPQASCRTALIRKALSKTCMGKRGQCSRSEGGDHILCNGRVARSAAIFPVRLCKAILSGSSNQLRRDGVTTPGVIGIQEADHGKNNEHTKDDGSAMIMQRGNEYCAKVNGHLLRFDDGEAPFL